MLLKELHIINYKNIKEADLSFAEKLNCFVGNNGQGKTNVLDAIYYLSFTKSAFNTIDSQNISHDADFSMIQGVYADALEGDAIQVTCAVKRGVKKQFRIGKRDYQRMVDHIGRIPLVMVSPEDDRLIAEGSDERRRFLDMVISQTDRAYLEHLTQYNMLLKQRNALLKQYAEAMSVPTDLFEVVEMQMVPHAEYIYAQRTAFVEAFVPLFRALYAEVSGGNEAPELVYRSQLSDRELGQSLAQTRSRDLILGWTSQGVHKDDMEMLLGGYALRRVGSQGQQKTYLIAIKLAQALYFGARKPILLLDDIFDKLDAERVSRIVSIVRSERFGQIFMTDTDRQHLTDIVRPNGEMDGVLMGSSKVFYVSGGNFVAG